MDKVNFKIFDYMETALKRILEGFSFIFVIFLIFDVITNVFLKIGFLKTEVLIPTEITYFGFLSIGIALLNLFWVLL